VLAAFALLGMVAGLIGGVMYGAKQRFLTTASPCLGIVAGAILAGYHCDTHPDTKAKPVASRLHQFISRGDAVFASLEEHDPRHWSLRTGK
jgi:uncharacterized membrane protein YeaQ/YmgE (transglycosylase-associated protein family)